MNIFYTVHASQVYARNRHASLVVDQSLETLSSSNLQAERVSVGASLDGKCLVNLMPKFWIFDWYLYLFDAKFLFSFFFVGVVVDTNFFWIFLVIIEQFLPIYVVW